MDAIGAFRPQRAVSSRDLSRHTANLLDEIGDTGRALAIVRYGRVVAVLAPHVDGARVGPTGSWIGAPLDVVEEVDIGDLDLDEAKRYVLNAVSREPGGLWSPNQNHEGFHISAIAAACGSLDIDGLIERFGSHFRITKLGRRASGALASDQVSVRSAAEREG